MTGQARVTGEARTVARRVMAAVRRGDHALACRTATAALAALERSLGEHDAELGELFNALGVASKHAGDYDEAERCYARALAIATESVGRRSVEVATLWHNLGGLSHARGRPDLAEPLARAAVKLREALLGADHPSVAADLAALATILDDLGRLGEAQQAYEDALAIFARDEQQIEVGHTLAGLGALFAGAGRWTEALEVLARARSILVATLGSEHPEVARVDHYRAVAAYGAGDRATALARSARALAVCERRLLPDHPLTEDVRATREAIRDSLHSCHFA